MAIFLKKNEIFLLEEIIKKDFSAKYKNSVLGILWSFIRPLLIMVLLTIIFSSIFARDIENFPVYFLAAKCIDDFFNNGTKIAMMSIKNNVNIIKRTAVPKAMFTLGGISSEFINFLITLIILVAVMIVTHSPFHLTIILAIIPVLCLLAFVIGIGLILAILCVYFTDIQHLHSVFVVMMMYASAIFYPMNMIPQPYYQILILNPFYWYIDQFRQLVIYGTIPDPLNIVNAILISAIILVVGIIIFKKFDKKTALKL